MNECYQKENLLRQLRLLTSRKPPENSSPSVEDDFHLKSHELYFELISRYPSFAIDNKLELEMWNTLYKAPIDILHSALHNRTAASAASGQPRSAMELKLRSVLLLDRASGVYLTLIHRLLQSLNDSSWPKSILGVISSSASPNGLFQLNRLGRSSGRFDLDLVTFSALQKSIKLDYIGHHWFRRRTGGDDNESSTSLTNIAAPRILSRGDRLPQDLDTQPSHSVELQSADLTNQPSESETLCSSTSSNTVSSDSTTAVRPPSPAVNQIDHISAVTYIVQHCLVHLGDVARYRQQSNVAAGYYLWAWAVHPDSGHPYNQLAILESAKPTPSRRLEALFYYYVRATACLYPFPASRSNLKSMLRTHIGGLHAATIKQTDTSTNTTDATDSTNTAIQAPQDPRHILLFLYAAFHLGIDPARLISSTKQFASIVSGGPQIRLSEQWIWRLVAIHIFLFNEHLSHNDPTAPGNCQSSESPEHTTLNKKDLTTVLLGHIMVHLIDWLAGDYLSLIEQHGSDAVRACCTPLSGILLLLLWLRKQAPLPSASYLTWSFSNYVPAFSERVVGFFNLLAHQSGFVSDCSDTLVSECEISDKRSQEDMSTVAFIDWSKLIHLPELATLQGFQPLKVPTQRQLGLTKPIRLRCPLRISSRLLHLQPNTSTTVTACNLHADEVEFSTATCSSDQNRLRLMVILQSLRVVAQAFPALIKETNVPFTKDAPTPDMSLVQFTAVCTPKPDLTDVVPKTAPDRKISNALPIRPANAPIPNCLSADNPAVNETKFSAETTEPNSTMPTANGGIISSKVETVTQNDDITTRCIDRPSQNSTLVESATSPTTLPSLMAEVKPEPIVSQGNTSGLSSTASGGLIVNAELAKFIQEQASQVAARQQRVGFSTAAATGGLHGGKPTGSDGLHKSSSTGTFRSSGSKGVSTRLCLSAAFRRDLPPRFAKRLQAELLEQEAKEARQTDSKSISETTSNLALLSLDQPAPLARKESEAPYDLNSLLSVGDTMRLNGTRLSAENSIDERLPLGPESPHDLIGNMPLASQAIASTSYDVPSIHPSWSVPSMLPPLSASGPYLNTEPSFPTSRTLFGAPVNMPPNMRHMLDWRVNQVSPGGMRPVQLDDYVPNSPLGLSRFPTHLSPNTEHYSRPVHPLADAGLPSGVSSSSVMTTVHEEDQARLVELMSMQPFGVPPLLDNASRFQTPGFQETRINTSMYHQTLPPKPGTEADQSSLNSYTTVP